MTSREIWSLVATPAGIALAAAMALVSVVATGENSSAVRPAVMVGKDAAEQADPPEISLGTAFDPASPQRSDYR